MNPRKRKIVIIVVIGVALLLPIIGYWMGQSHGSNKQVRQRTKRDLELHGKLVELDQWFLAGVAARPSTMTPGKYTLEMRWAGAKTEAFALELEISDGRVNKMTGLPIQDIVQTGKVVSWEQVDMDEGSSARFVGLIDGDGMWGRVYMEPGQGWHEGEPLAYGVWTVRRRSVQRHAASDAGVQSPYVQCVGRLTDYDAESPWSEDWVDQDGTTVHDDGKCPRATFRLSTPAIYAGRTVSVLYKYEGKDRSTPPSLFQKGKDFSFELPEGFFAGRAATIDNTDVRNLRVMP